MSNFIRATLMIVLLASCGGGEFSAPRDLDDACSIINERPKYYRAMQRTQQRWGVPVHVQMAVIHQESKFIGNAKTPHQYALGIIPLGRQSSAYGYSQALDGTWEEYQQEERRNSARRDRIEDATDFMGWYMHKSEEVLGISKWDAQAQYLAYHEGRTGFSRRSFEGKPWLMAVSTRVAERSQLYNAQLQSCRR